MQELFDTFFSGIGGILIAVTVVVVIGFAAVLWWARKID